MSQPCLSLECQAPFPLAVFSSAAIDALVQMNSSAAVKVMALLTLLAAGTGVFPRLTAADLCRAAGLLTEGRGKVSSERQC